MPPNKSLNPTARCAPQAAWLDRYVAARRWLHQTLENINQRLGFPSTMGNALMTGEAAIVEATAPVNAERDESSRTLWIWRADQGARPKDAMERIGPALKWIALGYSIVVFILLLFMLVFFASFAEPNRALVIIALLAMIVNAGLGVLSYGSSHSSPRARLRILSIEVFSTKDGTFWATVDTINEGQRSSDLWAERSGIETKRNWWPLRAAPVTVSAGTRATLTAQVDMDEVPSKLPSSPDFVLTPIAGDADSVVLRLAED